MYSFPFSEVLAQENCNDQPVPAQTDQEIKLNDELADPGMDCV
jgi:hypothetical protein